MKRGKKVKQYDLQGNFIKEWISISEASRELNIHQKNIRACCKNKRKTAGGYIWIEGENNFINKDKLIKELEAEIEVLNKTIEYWKNGFERELEANRKNVLELIKQDNIIKNQKEALNQANIKILVQKGHLKVLNKKADFNHFADIGKVFGN